MSAWATVSISREGTVSPRARMVVARDDETRFTDATLRRPTVAATIARRAGPETRYLRPARLVQHVLAFESIPSALQEDVQRELGTTGLVELVVLVGHYRQIAGVLSAFDVALPDGARAPF